MTAPSTSNGHARRLAVPTIAKYRPKDRRYEISDTTPGLRLAVEPSGTKAWVFRYRHPGSGVCANMRLGRVLDGKEPSADNLRQRVAELEDENRRLRAMLGMPPAPTSKRIGDHLSLTEARRLAVEIEYQRQRGIDIGVEHQLAKRQASERKASLRAVYRAARRRRKAHRPRKMRQALADSRKSRRSKGA